jgi:hypothetical protein
MKYIIHEENKLLTKKLDTKFEKNKSVIVSTGSLEQLSTYLDKQNVAYILLGTATCDEIPDFFNKKFSDLHSIITTDIEVYGNITKDKISYFDVGSNILTEYDNNCVIFCPVWYTKQDLSGTDNLYWVMCGIFTVLEKYEKKYDTVVISGLSNLAFKDKEIEQQLYDSFLINNYDDSFLEFTHIAYT